jgi:flavin reductase (DIM6/NTAB) family NADH-FMN oxidoreductase RutF
MSVDDGQFKAALSHFASGVTVVTTELEGTRYGMTVASFASLSLHPPLVLVCIEKNVKSHEAIATAGMFGVSMLAQTQQDISGRFASRREDKFEGIATRRGSLGMPLIEGAICTLECRLHAQLPGGDHSIFVGEVIDTRIEDGAPLVYYGSGYRALS